MRTMKAFGSVGLTILTFLQVLFLIVMGVIILSGVDDGGDIPGIIRCLWFIANGLLWALLFAALVVVSMVRHRHWRFLAVMAILVAIRLVFLWYQETCGGGAEDHVYVWFPIEAFVYFLWKYSVSLRHRLLFTGVNLSLYGIQCALVAKWFI